MLLKKLIFFYVAYIFLFDLKCCCREEPVADVSAEKPAVAAEPVLGEPMDILTGLQLVLKKSLAHDGLARGLHEAAKAIEKHAAQLCVLAEDCNQPDYSKLVQALCSEHNVNLISVPSAKKLGEWVGVSVFFCMAFSGSGSLHPVEKFCNLLVSSLKKTGTRSPGSWLFLGVEKCQGNRLSRNNYCC